MDKEEEEKEILKVLNSYTTDLFNTFQGDVVLKAIVGLLKLYKEEKEKNACLRDNLNHCIRSSAIKERLGIEEDISEEKMLDYIDTIVAEFNRLEDIEDKKVQIEYQKVFNKGAESVEDSIRAKIEKLEKEYEANVGREYSKTKDIILKLNTLQELLKEGVDKNGIQ